MEKKSRRILIDLGITAAIFINAAWVGILIQELLQIHEQITALFIFAVFLTALLTDGYLCGVLMTVGCTFFINYAFATPLYDFDFSIPENVLSAIIMLVISLCTSALTTRFKQVRMYQARSETERMRANLLRAVSHDLRTPLTTIYGSSSALLDGYDTMNDEQRQAMLGGIREDSEWLIRIVENLLSVTKLDGGKARLIKTPTVLDELIDSVIVKFNTRYPQTKVEISLPDTITIIPMDPLLIEQVLLNLLENGVRHAVGMTRLELSVVADDAQASFSVCDDGCGIERWRMDKLFDDRYSAADQQTDSGKGAGVGLSICATIIRMHGSEIRVECPRGGGACFSFSLPLE